MSRDFSRHRKIARSFFQSLERRAFADSNRWKTPHLAFDDQRLGTKAVATLIGPELDEQRRILSKEAYGASVSNPGLGTVTLTGEDVYLSPLPAPVYSEPPPFDDDDVMLQAYTWDVPNDAVGKNGFWYDHLR
jgi:hypothetical protein